MTQAPPGSALIGRWIISSVPANWFFVPDFGLRHNSPYPTSNITVKDDLLLAGNKLEPYIEAQMTMLRRQYAEPVFAGPKSAELLHGDVEVDECMLLLIRHQPVQGSSVLQVQTYVRQGTWLGIITLTTIDRNLQQARPDYERFLKSLAIAPPPPAQDGDATAPPAGSSGHGL